MYYLLVYYGEAVDEFIDSKSGARIDAKTGGILGTVKILSQIDRGGLGPALL